ncbi:PREDICTED: protein FAM64A isoform X1 [Mandrillus leucophaeus]|uniref:PICALM interacting mitotic regulator n=1 Tax=Mandrillus leucophaeus TaxID=9568 RepID=A0A2K5Y371_MANLE|nr:PREDICTED: protein FAM64A isoform X1 [Mandrillus leucophaeus]
MASRWQSMGTSVRRRSLRHQEQLEDSKELQPVASHQETSAGALGSLCRQFQRRLPLRAVNLNLCTGSSWKRLETPEPGQQGLQAAARSAKSALGAMSQRIQESCQSGTKWLVETQVKARRRKRGAQKGSGSPAHSLSQKNTRLSGAAPAHSATEPREKEHHHLSARMGSRAHPSRRSRREAAFRSPYSSTEPLCSPSESDSDPEPVGAGIQHLQKLSQELEEAIMAEERKQALSDRQVFVLKDVYASP